jgi:hypothetical protein
LFFCIGGINYRFSDRVLEAFASPDLYVAVFNHLQLRLPSLSLVPSGNIGIRVPHSMAFYEWVVVSGRRYFIRTSTTNPMNAIVAVCAGPLSYQVACLEHLVAFRLDTSELSIIRLVALRYLALSAEVLPEDSVWRST